MILDHANELNHAILRVKKLNQANDRNYETTAHVSQLKVWMGYENDELEEVGSEYEHEETDEGNNAINLDLNNVDNVENELVNEESNETKTVSDVNEVRRSKRERRRPNYLIENM